MCIRSRVAGTKDVDFPGSRLCDVISKCRGKLSRFSQPAGNEMLVGGLGALFALSTPGRAEARRIRHFGSPGMIREGKSSTVLVP